MIHSYKMQGYNVVLDVNSGSVHVVDDLAYDAIELYPVGDQDTIVRCLAAKYAADPSITPAEIRETLDDIGQLAREGRLYSEDELEAVAGELKARQSTLKALCLHVAHDCNMACKYCFAGEGEYSGVRGLMSLEVGKRALDYLIEHSGNRKNLEVDFFGGEPLLNWEAVVALTEYGRSLEVGSGKKFRFTLTTNGLLLREDMFDFINREMGNVVLSLDGRRCVHDRMRPDRGGRGTYDRVLPRFKALVDSRGGKDYYIRGTYTRENLDFAQDVLHMADLGFTELSIEPVVAPASAPYALRTEDLPKLLEQYDLLAAEMLRRSREGRGFRFYHFMVDLLGGPCAAKRVSGCGVGAEYLAVTPEGYLYPCHQFVGEPAFQLGDVFAGISEGALHESFLKANLYGRDGCRDCFAKFYCSGGCAANAHHFSGDIMGGYELGCALMRKRIECAIMLKAAEADKEAAQA